MTEREAFEAWMSDWQARVAFRKPTAAEAWFAACAWQRERDALLCESLGTATNGIYERNQECADKIRSGE